MNEPTPPAMHKLGVEKKLHQLQRMEKGEAAFCGRFHTTDNSSLGGDLPGKAIRFEKLNV